MITTLRTTLNNLSKPTKTLILNLTMIILLALALLFIYFSTTVTTTPIIIPPTSYQQYLDNYHQQFNHIQQDYRTFAFYQTYDELIFSQKQLDQKYKNGINALYNYTHNQFQQFYTIVTAIARKKGYQEIAQFQDDHYYDWEQFIPPVKDMLGYDGSHIFAAVAQLQFQVNRKHALTMRDVNPDFNPAFNWITLSEQEIIDCCPDCLKKKSPQYVYKYMLEYGISKAEGYPYTSAVYKSEVEDCRTEGKQKKQFKIKGWYRKSGCSFIRERLRDGPVVVWVDARSWRDYKGGILETCGNNRNHYALLVGRGIGYWKVRNSWGPLWGEHGHIRLKSGNTCGICGTSSFIDYQ